MSRVHDVCTGRHKQQHHVAERFNWERKCFQLLDPGEKLLARPAYQYDTASKHPHTLTAAPGHDGTPFRELPVPSDRTLCNAADWMSRTLD